MTRETLGRQNRQSDIAAEPEVIAKQHSTFCRINRRHPDAALRISEENLRTTWEQPLLGNSGMPLDVAIGRSLACCVHPSAAWRQLPTSRLVLLIAAYAGAGYLVVLTLLFIE